MKKKIKVLVFIMLLSIIAPMVVHAEDEINTPYYSYTYSEDYKQTIETPAPYVTERTINGQSLGVGTFNVLTDVTYDSDEKKLYLTDSGNNRIVILDEEYELYRVVDSFDNNGTTDFFVKPSSVYIKDNMLYIADTDNHRIVILDKNTNQLLNIIEQPEIKILGTYTFLPKSFVVDLAGRIYVIVQNVNKGIVQLDAEGNFERFVGAPDVTLTASQKFWRKLMNEKQRSQLEKAVPTEYNSIQIDQDGFLYLTTQDATIPPITKLNCEGSNILNVDTLFNPQGDTAYYTSMGLKIASSFSDIAVREDGIYATVDSSKGRIFVYNQEGVLLYCFGGMGAQEGTFQSPSSIEIDGTRIFVVDQQSNLITVFNETKFGTTVDTAVTKMLNGKYEEAGEYWYKVLQMCPAYDYANKCLARTDIQAKDYEEALTKLKGDASLDYYYKAFEGARKNFIAENFTVIFLGIIVLVVLIGLGNKLWKKYQISEKLQSYQIMRELKFSNHVMFHPIDGFWDLKREKRGSLKAAHILVAMFILLYGARVQFSGYCFTHLRFKDIDVIFEVLMMILPLALWIVSNWCFTSLMDGEGTMKDIYIATAYALKPYIITAIPMIILSHCLSGNEAFIYNTFEGVIMVWMLGLIFFGMLVTHNYTLTKGILTAILTIVGILLVLFLALVCFNVGQDIIAFVRDIYTEILYRTY